MSGKIAVDFGTSNTLVAAWDETRRDARPILIPDYSFSLSAGTASIPLIPSLIHYTPDRRQWIGAQVIDRGLYSSERTFRWMKRYISNRTPTRLTLDGVERTPLSAAGDFLNAVLFFARQELSSPDEEVAFSVPVETFEHYENWLTELADRCGFHRFRLIDEPSAAALGYDAHIQPGSVYMIFDFGGGTMHASVILIEQEESASVGRRCRVLGKAGRDIGGSTLDQWLYQQSLQSAHLHPHDPEVRQASRNILVACEKIKEKLSFDDFASQEINLSDGKNFHIEWTRSRFEDLMDRNGLFLEINRMIRSAINQAHEKGYSEEAIQSVLVVGGSAQVPAVQRLLRQNFGSEKVLVDRPLDAVVRGAAAFVAGVDFYDHIQHDYAIRYLDPASGEYRYRALVAHGTPYPTPGPVARLAVKPSYDGQTDLGLAIFEMAAQNKAESQPYELVFDQTGAARIVQITPEELEQRSYFWLNEKSPTFLHADPPAARGEARFEVEFSIDSNKRLLLTARDLRTRRLLYKDYPVVKLV